jgi:hypothetical protein
MVLLRHRVVVLVALTLSLLFAVRSTDDVWLATKAYKTVDAHLVDQLENNALLHHVEATDGIIPLINWGVVFHAHSMAINGASYFRSTVVIRLKVFKEPLAKIQLIPCTNAKSKQFRCTIFNKMITAVNSIAQTHVKEAIDRLNKILQIIPEIKVPTTNTRKRRQRRRSAASTGRIVPVAIQVRNRLRKKRGLADITGKFGNAFADLFNLPTKHDFDVLTTHVDEIGKVVDTAKDELVSQEKELSNFRIKNANALATEMVRVKDNSNNINNLRADMLREQQDHQALANKMDNDLAIMSKYLDYMTEMNMQKAVYTAGIDIMIKRIDEFTVAIRTLTTGYLHEMLVEPGDVQKILDQLTIDINTKYGGMFEITNTNVAFYYSLRDLVYARKGHDLMIMIKVPIQHTGGPLKVYRMDTFPVYRSHKHHGRTLIVDLPDYFAVSPHIDFYTEFDASFYETCRGEALKTCGSQVSMQRQASKVMSCAAALFYGDSKRIMEACTIKYIDRPPDPYRAVALSNGNYLIVGGDHKVDDDWKINCPGAASSHSTRTIPSCTMCVVDVPCFCSLTGRSIYIELKLTDCRIPGDTNFPDIIFKYMFNLPSIHTTFPVELAAKFQADVTKINERPMFDFTHFNIIKSDPDDVIEAENKIDADFKRTINADHNRTVMFYTKAGKLTKLASDWSDLTTSKVDDLSNQVSDFTDLLDAKSILGIIPIGVIIGIVAIALGIFVMIKKRI